MGYEFHKRPVKAQSLNAVSSGVTSTGPVSASTGLTVTGPLTVNGGLRHVTESGTTALANHGVSILATSTVPPTYTIVQPSAAGLVKVLMCNESGSSESAIVYPLGASFYTTDATSTTTRKATFDAANEALLLMSASTTKWMVVSNTNSVTLATT